MSNYYPEKRFHTRLIPLTLPSHSVGPWSLTPFSNGKGTDFLVPPPLTGPWITLDVGTLSSTVYSLRRYFLFRVDNFVLPLPSYRIREEAGRLTDGHEGWPIWVNVLPPVPSDDYVRDPQSERTVSLPFLPTSYLNLPVYLLLVMCRGSKRYSILCPFIDKLMYVLKLELRRLFTSIKN